MRSNVKKTLARRSIMRLLLATAFIAVGGCDKPAAPTDEIAGPEAAPANQDVVVLKPEGAALAGIVVERLDAQTLPLLLAAPGEVKANEYRSAQVTPRVPAQVLQRHAQLGDTVKTGQPLVTLTSIEVAEAQGEAQLKAREWARVQELGEAVVGGRRYSEAKVAVEQARAKLVAFGVDAKSAARSNTPLGQFTLTAPRDGTVLRDAFIDGERIEPGRALFVIADESAVWIEANIAPAEEKKIAEGGLARVQVDGHWLDGRVIQKHHLIDETTRTIPVRIEVAAAGDLLHTGEFVDCRIETGRIDNALSLPNAALQQDADGQWSAYVQEDATHFRRQKIRVLDDLGERKRIDGIAAGAMVVTQGAFFLDAERSKAGEAAP